MKKLITIAAGLLITGSAFANTVTLHRDAKLLSADYTTETAAFNAGYDIAEDLATLSQSELRNEFQLFTNSSVRNIIVDQTEITAEEFARARNDIQYRAVVNVTYHFDTKDND